MLLKTFRILIVDDDPIFLDELEAMVRSLGSNNIFRADCGENAISTLLAMDKPVDCVLCNYGMPRGNGLQVLQYIRMGRVRTLRPDSCVIVFSGDRSGPVLAAAKALDVSGYLITPFEPAQLEAAITRARSRYFKVDFTRYATVAIPEYVTGGAHTAPAAEAPAPAASSAQTPASEPQRDPAPHAVKADKGDPGRRAMADAILQSVRGGPSTTPEKK